ncbi:sialidase family protein [Amycolatopsis ultiminotia]|uniref:Sialidase family protein n=1 Tax=Amycolatopsis ultiminotia TaxID=543629 RepID=A0ABP6YDV8_9PSEU
MSAASVAARWGTAILLLVALVCAAPPAGAEPAGSGARPADRAPLRDGTGLYPRLVRLDHSGDANGTLVASVVDFDADGGKGVIYRSTDNGATFTEVGAVRDPGAKDGLCCTTLFELPSQVGDLPEGTLLWAASIGQDAADRRMSVPIWQSRDQGTSWQPLSVCRQAENDRGIWEPELSVDAGGRLTCHYADETDPAHSQQLRESFSTDGVTWTEPYPTVAPDDAGLRPGMPTVRRLGDGTYILVYEICGSGDNYDCATYSRTSADGADWGPPNDVGPRLAAESGDYFTHAPTVNRIDNGSGATRLAVVGQQLRNANGDLVPGSGNTVLISDNGAAGPWRAAPAPVSVPDPQNEPCANYSSTLVTPADGSTLLEIADDRDGDVCKPFYASAPMP